MRKVRCLWSTARRAGARRASVGIATLFQTCPTQRRCVWRSDLIPNFPRGPLGWKRPKAVIHQTVAGFSPLPTVGACAPTRQPNTDRTAPAPPGSPAGRPHCGKHSARSGARAYRSRCRNGAGRSTNWVSCGSARGGDRFPHGSVSWQGGSGSGSGSGHIGLGVSGRCALSFFRAQGITQILHRFCVEPSK
jgi:hypothetical protein